MSVRDYLEILNGCKIENGMDTSLIWSRGLLKIFPKFYNLKPDKLIISIEDDYITAEGIFNIENYYFRDIKKVALSDDVLLHCGNYSFNELIETNVEVLNYSLAGMKSYYEHVPDILKENAMLLVKDYESKIEKFNSFLVSNKTICKK